MGLLKEDIAKIDVGNNRMVTIHGDFWWEGSRALYYSARESGKVVVPITFLDYYLGPNDYTFEVITAENQFLVGVFDPSKSVHELFIMIDFKTGESWPNNTTKLGSFDLFSRLQKENPDLKKPRELR